MRIDCRIYPRHRHCRVIDTTDNSEIVGVFYADDATGAVGRVACNDAGQPVIRWIPLASGQALNLGPLEIWETRALRIELPADPDVSPRLLLPAPVLARAA